MKFLLDTNICIYVMKGSFSALGERIASTSPADVGISSITAGELLFGAEKSQHRAKTKARLDSFLSNVEVLPFDQEAAKHYGPIRSALEKKGTPIGPLDVLIAAHARSLGFTLVTNNVREFNRVPGLLVVNWTK